MGTSEETVEAVCLQFAVMLWPKDTQFLHFLLILPYSRLSIFEQPFSVHKEHFLFYSFFGLAINEPLS